MDKVDPLSKTKLLIAKNTLYATIQPNTATIAFGVVFPSTISSQQFAPEN